MAKKTAEASIGRGARLSHLLSEFASCALGGLQEGQRQQGADQDPEIGLPEQAHLLRRAGDDLDRHGQGLEGQVEEGQGGQVDQHGEDGQDQPGREGRPQGDALLGWQVGFGRATLRSQSGLRGELEVEQHDQHHAQPGGHAGQRDQPQAFMPMAISPAVSPESRAGSKPLPDHLPACPRSTACPARCRC